ncbi:MAG: hypothetical protein KDC88_13850 [Ignavibacteriae bacterium]|nr:hypothetical protein [Ignavibacteriota bacterium]
MFKNLLGLALFLAFFGCSQNTQTSIEDLESRYTELNELNNDLEQQRSDFYKLIRDFNSTRTETDQFDIASMDTLLGLPERDLLTAMFKEEKDISYNGLLSNIIQKNEEIRTLNEEITGLNEKIAQLEEKLPKAYVVQKGDTHYKIVRDFLVNQYGLDKKQAREIAWKTVMTDNLLPGNRIWLSYNKEESIVGTFVTQGEAKIAPMTYEQIAKRNMINKAIEQSNVNSATNVQTSSVESNNAVL